MIFSLWLAPAASAAGTGPEADKIAVWRWDAAAPEEARQFAPFPGGAKAESVAVHDLGSDGVDEIVVGSGFGQPPLVKVLRGDGSEILSFAPFDEGMLQGVNVAMGDLDGDGISEIVAAAGPGANAHARVFDNKGNEKIFPGGFFPFGQDFRGGSSVAVADLDGDGKAEIVAAAGPTGGPHVKVFRGDGVLLGDFFAFDNDTSVGLNIAAGDLDGDGKAEIVAALATGAPAYVRVFSGVQGTKTGEFLAIGGGFSGGLNLAVADVDGDGKGDVIAAPNGGGGPHVHVFDGTGKLLNRFFAYEEPYRGGVLLAAGRFVPGGSNEIVTAPAERTMIGRPQLPQYIEVSVADQRMRVYEYGRLVRTALVATGMKKYPTPLGEFSVLDKPYKVNYVWNYGPNNPDNYDLGWVTWNLRFYPHTYLHYAPWRKVFGVRGSHGCVNLTKADAKWLYE
ncbi:MAG TPA: L,D-transpeptidase family protein, partial [Patescibacteria group bacterium]|nr:L,D-transpeptidase family protein [Patescibacteria group bacterium]